MSARDEAVDLMEAEDARHSYVCSLGQLLDVVPADVLRRIADERDHDAVPAADTDTEDQP